MNFFKTIFSGYSELWKAIIRPPRDEYEMELLGPKQFTVGNLMAERTDLQITNSRGYILECSFYEPMDNFRTKKRLPCVIFLHGNSSSRVEAVPAVPLLLQYNICVFCLDLSGSGKSEGEYISLGWYERDDVSLVVDYLRNSGKVSTIGLWGRSMGAATALLHADRDPSIAGIVLDSAFTDLKTLCGEIARQRARVPGFILSTALKAIRKTIKKKAKFDIYDLTPISHVDQAFIPAMFAVAQGDDFIPPHHTYDLYHAYAGDKQLCEVEGDHNSVRPNDFFEKVTSFFISTLLQDCLDSPEMSPEKPLETPVQQLSEEEELKLAIELSLKDAN